MKPSTIYQPLAGLYGAVVALRNLFFETGIFRTWRMNLPVISVGNLSAGGTGKTPFVVLLARMLSSWGLRPAVVTLGYGRKSTGRIVLDEHPDVLRVGDEPAMMARAIPGTVVVDSSKRKAAEWVAASGLADAILIDDGFQHRSLGRDLDIVLVTNEEVQHTGHLLPAGFRREPLGSLKRAHIVAVTGCRGPEDVRSARSTLAWLGGVPIIGARLVAQSVTDAASGEVTDLRGRRVVAVSGIGNPASFERTLQELGAVVAAHRAFPDHHWFTLEDLESVEDDRRRLEAEQVVTTEKDFMRMTALDDGLRLPLFVVTVRQEIIEGIDILGEHLQRVLKDHQGRN